MSYRESLHRGGDLLDLGGRGQLEHVSRDRAIRPACKPNQ